MKKLTCTIGLEFGYWTVIDATPVSKSGHTAVLCRCKCGKEQINLLSDLYGGKATGCRSCKARDRSKPINIGDKYKHWTVIGGPKVENNTTKWLAECDCLAKTQRWFQGNELTNPNKCFSCQKCAQKKRGYEDTIRNGRVGDLTRTRYTKLAKSAEKRGHEFEVSMEYLWNLFESLNRVCAITGDYLLSIDDASLDRIDSSKGYIEGNVQWVTYLANVSKHIMSMNELYEFCRKVLNHANQQPSIGLTTDEGSETN